MCNCLGARPYIRITHQFCSLYIDKYKLAVKYSKNDAWRKKHTSTRRGSYMVWEINMEVCPRLEFDIMLFNCLGYDFYIYGAFEFLCNFIANL